MKVAVCIEYDGSKFCGWQIQHGQPSVQSVVEAALSEIADHRVRVHCAGRTDTGVHACGQVVHFETHSQRPEKSWVFGANSKLPEGVALLWARQVDDAFHARFSAITRRYRYVLLNRRVPPAYLAKRVSWVPRPLNIKRMQSACEMLVGTHDFSAFRSARCRNKVPVKTVTRLELNRCDDWIWLDIEASGFLHHMVRNIIGVLLPIGCEDQPVDWAEQVLDSRDRTLGGMTAPADGLYFVSATYPREYELPETVRPCRYW